MDYDEWLPVVQRVAAGTARDFPECSQEDLEQDLWVDLLTAHASGEMVDPTDKATVNTLWWLAKTAAWKEYQQNLRVSPQYGYRTATVRDLLETFFSKADWDSALTPEDANSELGSAGLEMSSDISRAYDRLTPEYKALVLRHFGLREELTKYQKKRLSKAIARMADILNSYQGQTFIGGRRAISNGHAQHIISGQA